MFLLKKPVKDYFPLTPLNSYKLGRFASDMADFKLEVTDSGDHYSPLTEHSGANRPLIP